jgi:hypothetical protein
MTKDYYSIDAMSASAIKRGTISMLAMADYYKRGVAETPGMRLGTLMHMAVLEPPKFGELTAYEGTKASNDYKALAALIGPENLINVDQQAAILEAVQVLRAHPVAGRYLAQPGQSEVEYYWEHDGHACKARIDRITSDGTMIEYKTTASLHGFQNAAERMNYHLQLGWYWKAAAPLKVVVIAQESNPPYDVAVMPVRLVNCKMWYSEALQIAERWWSGDRSGAYPDEFAFERPAWASSASGADELDIDDLMDNG